MKTTHRTAENICKWFDQWGGNIQNIKTAHATQYIKKKIKKCTNNLNRYFSRNDIQNAKMQSAVTQQG